MDSKERKIEELEEEVERLRKMLNQATNKLSEACQIIQVQNMTIESNQKTIKSQMYAANAFENLNASVVVILDMYHNGSVEFPLERAQEIIDNRAMVAVPRKEEGSPHTTLSNVSVKEYINAKESS